MIPAASLPFSTGAMIYIFKDRISALSLVHHRLTPFILFGLYLANYAVNRQLGSLDSTGFYLSYVLNAMLVMTLACSSLPFLSRRGDSFLGDFSYPVYLIHLQAGLLVLALGDSLARGQLKFALVTLPIVLLLSWVLIKLLEKPIERLRRVFKETPMASPDQQSPESAHSRASSARGCI